MEHINKELEKQLAEFDHLFQECVLIDKQAMLKFDNLMNKFNNIRKEIIQHSNGNYKYDIIL